MEDDGDDDADADAADADADNVEYDGAVRVTSVLMFGNRF
jgi:hypothetical protein